jgi:Uncharacterized protein conserved in bacteria
MMDSHVTELIRSSGLHRIEDALIAASLSSLKMNVTAEEDDGIPSGHSKLGGKPDMRAETEWPMYNKRPLHFIGQVNFEEMEEQLSHLPRQGLLSIFYDAYEQPWGFDPADRGRWKLLYFDNIEGLERKEEPEEIMEQGSFSSAISTFTMQTTLPPWESLLMESLQLTDEEDDLYMQLGEEIQEYYSQGEFVHRVLGHPDLIQGDMQLECQLVTNGLYCGDNSGYDDPRRNILEQGAGSWKLLLQIDSDEAAGMSWGSEGRLYFWILEQDLLERNFDHVWVVLQCS